MAKSMSDNSPPNSTPNSTKDSHEPQNGIPKQRPALPGKGGIARIANATLNSLRGISHGAQTESAIKQELVLLALGILLSFFIAQNLIEWLALIGSLLLVLTAEYLNTSIERLCNHVTPRHHTEIRDIKDLASGGVFFMLVFAGIVWLTIACANLFGW